MTIAFADSTFYIALLIVRDSNHSKAIAAAQAISGSVVTTEYVLTEVANYCGSSRRRSRFGEFLTRLQTDPSTTIVGSSHDLWQRGLDLYLQRPDKEWSLTDCISFVVMQERAIADALTADHHFEQAGFTVLLGPTSG